VGFEVDIFMGGFFCALTEIEMRVQVYDRVTYYRKFRKHCSNNCSENSI